MVTTFPHWGGMQYTGGEEATPSTLPETWSNYMTHIVSMHLHFNADVTCCVVVDTVSKKLGLLCDAGAITQDKFLGIMENVAKTVMDLAPRPNVLGCRHTISKTVSLVLGSLEPSVAAQIAGLEEELKGVVACYHPCRVATVCACARVCIPALCFQTLR
jgi:hypothetical protein